MTEVTKAVPTAIKVCVERLLWQNISSMVSY